MESGSDRTTPSPAAQDRIAPSRPSFSGGRGRRATTSSAAAHCDASTLEAFEALPASPDDPDAQHRLADFLAAVLSQISPETGGNAVEGGDDGEASPAAAAAVAVEQRQPGNAARPGMTITQPGGLHVFVKLVRACPRWAQVEAWDQLLSLARHSVGNRELLCHFGLVEKLLSHEALLHDSDTGGVAGKLVQLLGLLGNHSMTARELRAILRCMRADTAHVSAQRSARLLGALQTTCEKDGPDAYFDFTGTSSALMLPPIKKWPVPSGFSISTWVRLNERGAVDESVPAAARGSGRQYIYAFKTATGHGYGAYFSSGQLVLEVTDGRDTVASQHTCIYQFAPELWHMVTVVYQYNRVRRSKVKCFVNGGFDSDASLKLSSTSQPFLRCIVGAADSLAPDTMLRGQLSAIYLFGKALGAGAVAAFRKLGPGYVSNLQYPRENMDTMLTAEESKELYSSGLHSNILFNYNPKACEGDTVFESSPGQRMSFFVHSPHASMMAGVRPIKTQSLQEALLSSGGIQVLLPLFSQLAVADTARATEASRNGGAQEGIGARPVQLAGTLLSLLLELMTSSAAARRQMRQTKGFLLLGYLLEQADPEQLDQFFLNVMFDMATFLANSQFKDANELISSLYDDVLFRGHLWSRAAAEVQLIVYQKIFEITQSPKIDIRSVAGIGRLLVIMFQCYTPAEPSTPSTPSGRASPEPSGVTGETRQQIRDLILATCKSLLVLHPPAAITFAELEHIVWRIKCVAAASGEAAKLMLDYVEWFADLVQCKCFVLGDTESASMVLIGLVRLLDSENAKVRVRGLAILSSTIAKLGPAVRVDCWACFSAAGSYLRHRGGFLSADMRDTLLGLLYEPVADGSDSGPVVRQPAVLMTMFETIDAVSPTSNTAASPTEFPIIRQKLIAAEGAMTLSMLAELASIVSTPANLSHFERNHELYLGPLLLLYGRGLLGAQHFNSEALLSGCAAETGVAVARRKLDSGTITQDEYDHIVAQASQMHLMDDDISGQMGADVSSTYTAIRDHAKTVLASILCHCALTVKGGWQCWHTLVALASEIFPDYATPHPASGCDCPTRDGVIVEFLATVLDSFHGVFAKWHRTKRPFVTLLAAKENATVLTNMVHVLGLSADLSLHMIRGANLVTDHVNWLVTASQTLTPQFLGQKRRSKHGSSPQGITGLSTPMRPRSGSGVVAGLKERMQRRHSISSPSELLPFSFFSPVRSSGTSPSDDIPPQSGSDDKGHLPPKAKEDPLPAPTPIVDVDSGPESAPPSVPPAPTLVVPASPKASSPGTDENTSNTGLQVDAGELSPPSITVVQVEGDDKGHEGAGDRSTPAPADDEPIAAPNGSSAFRQPSPSAQNGGSRSTSASPAPGASGLVQAPTIPIGMAKEIIEQQLGLLDELLLNNRIVGVSEGGGRQLLTSGEFVSRCTLLVLAGIASSHEPGSPATHAGSQAQAAFSPAESERSTDRDSVVSEADARRLRACAIRAPAGYEGVVTAICTVLGASVINVYKGALESGAAIEPELKVCVPLLQELFSGSPGHDTGDLSKALIAMDGQPLLKSSLSFLQPGGSVAALAMHLASRQWFHAFGTSGVPLVNRMVQGELQAHARQNRELAERRSNAHLHEIRRSGFTSALDGESVGEQGAIAEMASVESRRHAAASSAWQRVLAVVTNDRGVWSSSGGEAGSGALDFWRLDDVEDGSRCRRRLVRNPHGSTRPEATVYSDSDDAAGEHSGEPPKIGVLAVQESWIDRVRDSISIGAVDTFLESDQTENDIADGTELETDASILTEDGGQSSGKVLFNEPCEIITPRGRVPGQALILRRELYLTVDEKSSFYRDSDAQRRGWLDSLNGRWLASEIVCASRRCYMLQHTALEVFFTDHSSVLLRFENSRLQRMALRHVPVGGVGGIGGGGAEYLLGYAKALHSVRSPADFFRRCDATTQWLAGDMSNFDYLMLLNTVAGRNYHDLAQYPVFPWVLSDYTSPKLDLDDAAVYRDLAKPVGALNPDRLESFLERYEEWDVEAMGSPPCHYGSHYSTPGYVLYWLIRAEPFSELFLTLQGGNFDHADRMFYSLAEAWQNCLSSTSDVRELIPELYYFPEMLVNENRFDFGSTKNTDHGKVGDVALPPWAASPEDFIRQHRTALESKYVSEHLHLWIDLIFGHKQRGQAAVDAANVFYYLAYEGRCKLDEITDPVLREAAEAQILNFGQVPLQLFSQPHPAKQHKRSQDLMQAPKAPPAATETARATNGFELCMVTDGHPVTFINVNGDDVVTISCNQSLWSHRLGPGPALAPDPQLNSSAEASRRQLGEPFDQKTILSPACFGVLPGHRAALAAGYWDSSLKCFELDGRHHDSLFAHSDVLTCVAVSPNGMLMASGSRDATVCVWRYARSPLRMADAPVAVLVGHEQAVACVAINAGLDTVVSGSAGLCLIHKVNGDLVRVVQHPSARRIHRLVLSTMGDIIAYYRDKSSPTLAVFSPNGKLTASVATGEQLMDIVVSWRGQHVLTGGFGRQAVVRELHSLHEVQRTAKAGASIRAVALAPERQAIVVGLASGEVGLASCAVPV